MDQVDSLEDWVAIKEDPFTDTTPRTRLQFHVCWNEVEGKVGITCRERSRVASDTESEGWTGVFSFRDLHSIHEQLCLVCPSLGPYLPTLPVEPRGIWTFLTSPPCITPDDELFRSLENYMQIALDVCGRSLVISTFFENHSFEEYFESVGELKRRRYEDDIRNAEDELRNVLFLRQGAINMLDMSEVYLQEDLAMFKLNVALAQLYNYQLQPFLDVREVAFTKVKEARSVLDCADLGKRRKAEAAAMIAEWQGHYTHALDMIQELYIKYYTTTVHELTEKKARMLADKKKFGKNAFEVIALERLHRVDEDLSLEQLHMLRATRKQHQFQREKVKQEITSVEESANSSNRLMDLEQQAYDWQQRIYDLHVQIIDEEESLIKKQISTLAPKVTESVVFYDAVEDVEQLESDGDEENKPSTDPRVVELKQTLTKLHRKRAQLRNRQSQFTNTVAKRKKKKVPTATLR